MGQIRVLSESTANRIAAGEVVERPASILKELVENAIDAGASRIDVQLKSGGKELVRVIDDGGGMSAEDLRLAVQRFATSKIASADDLATVSTMGFRGEALPSIGAVAQLQITTRQADEDEGHRILVRGGEVVEEETIAAPAGTDVEVTRLFFNTPARAKFLATTATERGHCVEWAQRLALARPDIGFRVTHDGKPVFTTGGQGDIQAVVAAIHGSNNARLFLPVDFSADDVTIRGFVSSPRLTRGNRRAQLFFVNGRFVRSSSLSHAISAAYGMLLPSGKQPLTVLHIEMSPAAVDPNVHPTKIEIRFGNPGRMHDLTQQAVEAGLAEAGLRSLTGSGAGFRRTGDEGAVRPAAGRWDGPSAEIRQRASRLRVNPFSDSVDVRDDGLEVFGHAPDVAAEEPQEPFAELGETTPAVLGQLAGRYIVATAGGDLLLIDQHRAAERVLLQKLTEAGAETARQLLAVPQNLELSPAETAAVEDNLEGLMKLGFEFEKFGPNAYLLRSIPTPLVGRDYATIVSEMVADLAQWSSPSSLEKTQEKLAATVCCHAAIKAGMHLTDAEMQRLVEELVATETPAVCPHGDPIIVAFPLARLDAKFKRS
jgi:DNA mismatch repair protein MutL